MHLTGFNRAFALRRSIRMDDDLHRILIRNLPAGAPQCLLDVV
jgi:hypothetical protein